MVRVNVFAYLLPLCLICSLASAQTSSSLSPGTPVWTASEMQLQMLDAEVARSGYRVRPPLGYQDLPLSPDENMTTARMERRGDAWQGAPHPYGGFPVLEVRTTTYLKSPAKPIVPRELIKKSLGISFKEYKNLVASGIEEGTLNGLSCARIYWKGTLDTDRFPRSVGRLAHGFIYVAWNPQTKTVLVVNGEDTDPYYRETSRELEAAALTLKPD